MAIQVTDTRIAWEGSSWRLRVNTLRTPGGAQLQKGHIEHPGAVVLVPVVETAVSTGSTNAVSTGSTNAVSTGSTTGSPQILMLRQYRLSLDETILELPAGTKGWHEDWLDCAQRELREETGYRADTLQLLGEIWPAPGVSNELMHIYLATGLQPDPLPGDADEEIELQPMALDELVNMAQNGRLRDAKSIIGILWAAAHLPRN
ncbi:MAG: NUDIX hydrolase [Chloroflexota bacterium]